MTSAKRDFRVKLDGDPKGKMEIAAFTLPFDAREAWGKARVPVKVTINGHTYLSTVSTMHGKQIIVVNANVRAAANVKAGDEVQVTMEPDREARTIEVPAEMKKALGARYSAALEKLAYTYKKEFVQSFVEAKKEETRQRRVEKMKEMLASGKIGS